MRDVLANYLKKFKHFVTISSNFDHIFQEGKVQLISQDKMSISPVLGRDVKNILLVLDLI